VSHHRGQCPDGRQHRRRHRSDGRHGQRNLHNGVTLLVLDNDAANVAFVNQLAHFLNDIFAGYLELFEKLIECCHRSSVACVVP